MTALEQKLCDNANSRLPSSREFEKPKDFAKACELIDSHET